MHPSLLFCLSMASPIDPLVRKADAVVVGAGMSGEEGAPRACTPRARRELRRALAVRTHPARGAPVLTPRMRSRAPRAPRSPQAWLLPVASPRKA